MKFFTLKAFAIAGALALSAQAADALSCSASGVNFTLTQTYAPYGDPLKVDCFPGANDSNTIDSNFSLFNVKGWTLGEKYSIGEDGQPSVSGDMNVSFSLAPTNGGGPLWTVSNSKGYSSIVLVLKQANAFAAFLLDTNYKLAGTWKTEGPGQSTYGLSHASVYYTRLPSAVPLPATGLLILGGMGALAAFRARRKAA